MSLFLSFWLFLIVYRYTHKLSNKCVHFLKAETTSFTFSLTPIVTDMLGIKDCLWNTY